MIRYSIIFMVNIKRPLLGSLMLIFISVLIRLYVAILRRKWITYLIVLLFLGGIIVLFVYVCTLISRMKTSIKLSYRWPMLIVIFIIRNLFYLNSWDFRIKIKSMLLSVIYRNINFILILLAVVYLLLVLITRIKISQKFKGGLKSKINEI